MFRDTIMALAIGMAALSAAPSAQAGEPPAPAEVKPQKKKFNFEGDTISTDYLKPGTMLIEGVSRGRRSSLIEVRLDFVNEILRSADDI
ncbi:MAG TPA: hypothetical protein PK095_05855 [Myxococcota bacterium]|nr:hypothetical protein [Myxococcota bacterium]